VFRYRLHWLADEPHPGRLARVGDTFSGAGGRPGHPRPSGVTRFVVDFGGGPLSTYARGELFAQVRHSRGALVDSAAYPVEGKPGRWRSYFEIKAGGEEPVDLWLYLRNGLGDPQTETWAYQHFPERSNA
jgi:glucans biosynthesis protein